MLAFITGSRAYGNPRNTSDVDLVVRVDEETKEMLYKAAGINGGSLTYGSLNLILCTTDEQYEKWKQGTELLKRAGRPVERSRAVEVFKSLGTSY